VDNKPNNILVLVLAKSHIHVLLTDFGISRTIYNAEDSETDGPNTGRTDMYCSPEVANCEARGQSSDIFSLGCVFSEMLTIMVGSTLEAFEEHRTDDGTAFHRNLSLVTDWLTDWLVELASKPHSLEYLLHRIFQEFQTRFVKTILRSEPSFGESWCKVSRGVDYACLIFK
jgi:serine/threonine protein kinase